MLFNSLHFLIFFPVVVMCYFLLPNRFRWIWLLVASYYFYMSWNPAYAALMLTSTIITYLSGLFLEQISKKDIEVTRKKSGERWIIGLSLTINLGILFFFKYFNFLNDSIRQVFISLGFTYEVNNLDLLLPVGISFYTFQALGYTLDVYRGTIKAERNIGKYALFVSFFPQLVAGPIERSYNLLPQLQQKTSFNYDNMRSGLLQILWGIFQKVVIADRLSMLVNTVYNDVDKYYGLHFIIATIFFSFQILCDFAAYSDIAIGASRILGINLMKNFDRPYFSQSIREFWRRWHISLSTWFKDYLYFPLGGSKGSKLKTYRNIMIVFLVSGLWHGANWTFVIWGALHGFFQIFGLITESHTSVISEKMGLEKNSLSHKIANTIITFSLVAFAWIFFRANTISDAFYIVSNLSNLHPEILFTEELYSMGMDAYEFRLCLYLILLVLVVNYFQGKSNLGKKISSMWLPIRWSMYIGAIIFILIFGIYGSTYDPSQFIYFQF